MTEGVRRENPARMATTNGHNPGAMEDSIVGFERNRIKVLQEERQYIQKKTFTKWVNSYLNKVGMTVNDLFTDLADGKMLLKLLEIISGEKIGKAGVGKMRIQKVENLNKSLAFLHTKVRLESIGAEDIVDGNPTLILGLIWTIILRFQIQEIEFVDETDQKGEKKSAKEALLLWAQRKTHGYQGVKVENFTSSWKNGLGFSALIHSHRPDLIDYDLLRADKALDNLNYAFDVAERHLGIARLLDPEDVLERPDEKSVITYVSSYYHTFAKLGKGKTGGKRIAKIVESLIEIDRLKAAYERLCSDLLKWLDTKTRELEHRSFPNHYDGLHREFLKFKDFRLTEKPPRMMERGNIEVAFFAIQTKLKGLGQKIYVPPEGYSIQVIDRHWKLLEVAEHQRELALREAMIRVERLERMAEKFERKATLRDTWLTEMTNLLADQKIGKTIPQIDACLKKFEAIKNDIQPREERFAELREMTTELVNENYHGKDKIKRRYDQIFEKWRLLLDLLDKRRRVLDVFGDLVQMIRDADSMYADLKNMENSFRSADTGQHLASVQALLQKHALKEAEIGKIGKLINDLNGKAPRHMNAGPEENTLLQSSLGRLNEEFKQILQMAQARRMKLDEALSYHQFEDDAEEEDSWAMEKLRTLEAIPVPKDLRQVVGSQQKAKSMESELGGRWGKVQMLKASGEGLISRNHSSKSSIQKRLNSLMEHWTSLRTLLKDFLHSMDTAAEFFQYHADANEIESWLRESSTILNGMDPSDDSGDVEPLLKRHARLDEEIRTYDPDVKRLAEQSNRLQKAALVFSKLRDTPRLVSPEREIGQGEPVIEESAATEMVPQVLAMFPFKVGEFSVKKSEVLTLVEKANNDWWHVRKSDGTLGAAPANHLKEIDPKVHKVRTVTTTTSVLVTRSPKSGLTREIPVLLDPRTVLDKQSDINTAFANLKEDAAEKRRLLGEAAGFRDFLRDCSELRHWIAEQQQSTFVANVEDPIEILQKRYDSFVPEYNARRKQLIDLQNIGSDLIKRKHHSAKDIRITLEELVKQWRDLEAAKAAKEKDMEYRTGMEAFENAVRDASTYILEKSVALRVEAPANPDVATMRNLHKKIANFERELVPIQQTIDSVKQRGIPLRQQYPQESKRISAKEKELDDQARKLQEYLYQKRKELEGDVSHTVFHSALAELQEWNEKAIVSMDEQPNIEDAKMASELHQQHAEFVDEIKAHDPEYDYITELAKKTWTANPSLEPEVRKVLNGLQHGQQDLKRRAGEKADALLYVEKLLELNRRINRALDDMIRLEGVFQESPEMGNSPADVETQLRRHEDFHRDLDPTEERCDVLLKHGKKLVNEPPNNLLLIRRPHERTAAALMRLDQGLKAFPQLRELSKRRKVMLSDFLAYQVWKGDVEDLNQWMDNLLRAMVSDPSEDDINSEKAYRRHAKQVAEIQANSEQVQKLTENGKEMIMDNHLASPKISVLLNHMLDKWEELTEIADARNSKFEQAAKARGFFGNVDKAKSRLVQIQFMLQRNDSMDENADPRKLRTELKNAESNIKHAETMVELVKTDAAYLAENNHFNGPKLLKTAQELDHQLKELQDPAKRRWAELDDVVKRNQVVSELEKEISWIEERLRQLNVPNVGKTLDETASLLGKLETIEQEMLSHEPGLLRTMAEGNELVKKYPDNQRFATLYEDIIQKRQQLLKLIPARRLKLEMAQKGHSYRVDHADVIEWLEHTLHPLRNNPGLGKDTESTKKLIDQNNKIERELQSEKEVVEDLERRSKALIEGGHPDAQGVATAQKQLRQRMDEVDELLHQRKRHLDNFHALHGFLGECDDLENWLVEQRRVAENNDVGVNSETLAVTKQDFENFDKRVAEFGPRRIKMLKQDAESLRKRGSSIAAEVDKRIARIDKLWSELNRAIEDRDDQLDRTGDIFGFDEQIASVMERLQDALSLCYTDDGRDLKDALIKQKRHEEAGQETEAIAGLIDPLKEESIRLIESYPGKDAEHVSRQREILQENWDVLRKAVVKRKADLDGLVEGHKWLNASKDLLKWAENTREGIALDRTPRDKVSMDILIQQHDDIKADIQAHAPDFEKLVSEGEALVADEGPLTAQILDRVRSLRDVRNQLMDEWENQKNDLEELYHIDKFLRDLDVLDAASAAQETHLQTKEPSDLTVDQIRKLISRHTAFERVVAQQAEKLRGLEGQADMLIQEQKIDPKLIIPRLNEVVDRRKRIGKLTKQRDEHLHDALVYAEFNDVASDMDSWIEEKTNHMRSSPIDELGFEEKIRKLMKHQTFEAELNANSARIDYVKKSADELLRNKHEKSPEIGTIIQELSSNWNHLLKMAAMRSKALDDAKDMVEFQNECDRTEKWMREKEQMLSAEDLGNDLEHCLFLQRKLDDVGSDMKFDESQISSINALADKLSKSGAGNVEAVAERRRSLNTNWENLHRHLDQYRAKLNVAKDLHALGNAVDDTTELLMEKSNGLNMEQARDLDGATGMIRKHESLLRDFDACVQRMDSLEKEIVSVHKLHPNIVKHFKLDEKMLRLRDTWNMVDSKIAAKKAHLDRMRTLLQFLKDVQDFCDWSEEIQIQINNAGLAQDSAEAERLKEHHDDVKATIQGREDKLSHLIHTARGLARDTTDPQDPGSLAEDRLRNTWNNLNAAWNLRSVMLRQCHEQQVFYELVDQVESWLTSKEAFLANEELGSSMSEVESLLRKHNAFDNTVQRQSDKVTDLDKFAQRLIADNHYAKSDIADRYQLVHDRLESIQKRSNYRRAQLEQSERYQQFSKSLSEFNAWMQEKFQLATDNSWKDPVHLENKRQKQASFETELSANQGRMEALIGEGEAMIEDGHFASEEIKEKVKALKEDWQTLLEASVKKKHLLTEVQHGLSLMRRIDEFESWLDAVEAVLQSDDIGSNLSACLKLVEKTEATRFQVSGEAAVLNDLNETANGLPKEDQLLSTEIVDRLEQVNKRYDKLDFLNRSRVEVLQEAQKLHHFNLEHHEIVLWYKEKQTQVASRDTGTSLAEAQNLLRKIIQLEDEINEYGNNVQRTLETGCELAAGDTFSPDQITGKLDELKDTYKVLNNQCAERKHQLKDSVEAQKFYAEAYELDSTFAQKKILLETNDVGEDEDSTKLLMKKLDAVDRDVHAYGKTVERLADLAESMRDQKNYDLVNIQRRFETVKEHHRELSNLVKARRHALQDGQKLFGFFDEGLSLMALLREKMVAADSEDYGTDVEHVDILLQKFANFQKGLSIIQIRVKTLNDKAQALANEGHPQMQLVKERTTEVNDAWVRLQESTRTRNAALLGAREVHVFVRDCDETIGWIQERDAAMSSEDYGQDLESVQSLIRRHDGFQRDLAPFGQRVAQLGQEALNIVTRYPEARLHVERKQNEMQEAWHKLSDKSVVRKERLHFSESLQSYLNKYREFSLWLSEMLAVITSYDLPQDVRRAEALLRRHSEHKAEIDSRYDDYSQIKKDGVLVLQRSRGFMADEIRDKLQRLENGYESLCDIWKKRNELYALNLDVQVFIRDCNMLNSWMSTQEPVLRENYFGESIHGVEELLRKHDDFAKTVENQEERLNLVRRLTELEKAYNLQLLRETEARSGDRQRHELDRLDQTQRMNQARLDGKSGDSGSTEPERKTSVGRAMSFTPSALKKRMQDSPLRSESFVQKETKPTFMSRRSVFLKKNDTLGELPPVDMEGMLDRKQELDSGGTKSTSRSWKGYHTVLCGQLLCFFKKRQASYDRHAAAPPLNLYECIISQAFDYKKKDNVFRVHLRDGSEYLFLAEDEKTMREWMDKIQFHAALPPNLQLLSYKEGQEEARKSQDLPGGDDSERVVQFARTLPRNTPSPMSNGNSSYEQTAPMPKPRITRLTLPESPDSASSYGNGSSAEVVSPVPEYPAAGSNEDKRFSWRDRVGRSESFGGDADAAYSEREVDVRDARDRTRATSTIVSSTGDGNFQNRGVTLPAGSGLGGPSSDDVKRGANSEKRGSKASLINIFKRRHDKEKA